MKNKTEFIYVGKVVSAYDADTIRVDFDLGLDVWVKKQIIRLHGINAPELRGAEKEAGYAARDFLREMILGKEVVIQTFKDKKGKYGRWIGEIWLNGVSVNKALVDAGHAVYKKY